MATKFRHYTPSPGRFIPNAALQIWSHAITYGAGSVSFELTTLSGFKMIKIVLETEGYEQWDEYVYMGAPADEVIPARYALTNDGFTLQFYTNYRTGFFPASWADVKGLWDGIIIPFVTAALDWSTNGSVGDVTYQEITAAAGLFSHYVAIVPVLTDAEVLIFQGGVYGLNNDAGYDGQELFGADLPTPGLSQQGSDVANQLKALADAVNAIARRSTVTWINNEGGFAELLSGDIVTPP